MATQDELRKLIREVVQIELLAERPRLVDDSRGRKWIVDGYSKWEIKPGTSIVDHGRWFGQINNERVTANTPALHKWLDGLRTVD